MLRLLGPVLTPFVVAAVLAYALTPLVDRLDEFGKGRLPRVVAVVIVQLLFILALLSLVLMVCHCLAMVTAASAQAVGQSGELGQRQIGR